LFLKPEANKRVNRSPRNFILLAAIIAGLACIATPAQDEPTAYLIKQAAAYDALREGRVLSEQETLEANRKAYNLFLKSRSMYKEIDDRDGEGQALFEASQAANALGDRFVALRLGMDAVPFFNDEKNKIWRARLANHLGLICTSLGERKGALQFYWSSLNFYKELDDFDEAIPVINNIGRHFEEGGEFDKALEMFDLTLRYVDSGVLDVRESEEATRGLILSNIAGIYLKQGKTKEALETYERALAFHRATGLPKAEMKTLNNIGTVYYKMGDNIKALYHFHRALLLNRLVGDRSSEAATLMNLMALQRRTGNVKEAVFFGKQAINKYQEMRSNIAKLIKSVRSTYLRTIENDYRALAEILIEAGLFAQAEQVLRMLKEEEFFEFVGRDESEIESLGQRVALTPKEQELIARYTSLSGRITTIGARFLKLDARRRLLEKMRESLTPAEKTEYDLLSAQLADANAAFKLFLDKELSTELGAENKKTIEYDRGLQANVALFEKGTVILHTVVVQDRYRVVLTTPTVQVDGKTDIDISELNKKIFAFRAALRDRAVDPRPLGKELYDILILPIEKDLRAAGARTLVWSLDGPLRYIPFAALSPDGKTYLVEKYQNTVLTPRTRDGISAPNTNWNVLGVGVSAASTVPDPTDAGQLIKFKALPGAKTELMKIVRDGNKPGETGIFSGRRLMNKDFTAAAFSDSLAGAGGRKFNAVHMASHFRLGDDRSSSFLLLGDGTTLSLEEISKSPRISFGGVELVTLSACNTAFGTNSTGREIDSLADIIQAKSGKAVLATLWSVSDESTSMLMSEFYRIRKDIPVLGKAGAIQAVQKQLIEGRLKVGLTRAEIFRPKPDPTAGSSGLPKFVFDPAKPFAHPYYWSPFVLIGNWR
jgi:CHAT domain-containing protein/tetratricopeptide (TPR) repeat protein